jgi:hypothetical protein
MPILPTWLMAEGDLGPILAQQLSRRPAAGGSSRRQRLSRLRRSQRRGGAHQGPVLAWSASRGP